VVAEEGSAAMRDDAQPVVVGVSEAVGSTLDELHFAMKAFGDAVVAGEAPHADDLLGPVGERLGEDESGLEPALAQHGNPQRAPLPVFWCVGPQVSDTGKARAEAGQSRAPLPVAQASRAALRGPIVDGPLGDSQELV